METEVEDLILAARALGYKGPDNNLYEVRDWLREEHGIHVEVGSIWDELNNKVESMFYTITAPIEKYYMEPRYENLTEAHSKMLFLGTAEALSLLRKYEAQKSIKVNDDQLVVAYLKGYGDKYSEQRTVPYYRTSIETYAYLRGKQGDYIEEGLTDDDIVALVRNRSRKEENLQLKE